MNKRIILFLGGFLLCTFGFSQTNYYKQAEKKYNENRFSEALELYKMAYKQTKKSLKPDCLWKTAECYRQLGDIPKAKVYYEKVAKCTDYPNAAAAAAYLSDSTKTK